MFFSVSNDGIEWSLDFGPDSVTLSVKDLVHEMTLSSQETPPAAWSLLVSQRQEFLNNHLALVPVTLNQQLSDQMREELLSSVGTQDMDTSWYQVSADLDDVEFYWENAQLEVGSVFSPGIDTPFAPLTFDDLEMGDSAENPTFARRKGGQGGLSSSFNNNSLSETNTAPRIAEKSSNWNKNRKCSDYNLKKIGFNKIYHVCVLI